jgi:hypothetical protein
MVISSSGLSGTMCHFNLTNYMKIGTHTAFDLLILNDPELYMYENILHNIIRNVNVSQLSYNLPTLLNNPELFIQMM